jgi:hypothetical protein
VNVGVEKAHGEKEKEWRKKSGEWMSGQAFADGFVFHFLTE